MNVDLSCISYVKQVVEAHICRTPKGWLHLIWRKLRIHKLADIYI